MTILQEGGILIKILYLSKQYGAWRLLYEVPDWGWKLESIDSLLKRINRIQLSGNPAAVERVACSSGGPRAQSGAQAKKAPISSWDFVWNRHSLFKCVQDNLPQFPAQMLQTTSTSCAAIAWSQSYLPSHALIKKLIVCNKSCYCCS